MHQFLPLQGREITSSKAYLERMQWPVCVQTLFSLYKGYQSPKYGGGISGSRNAIVSVWLGCRREGVNEACLFVVWVGEEGHNTGIRKENHISATLSCCSSELVSNRHPNWVLKDTSNISIVTSINRCHLPFTPIKASHHPHCVVI